MSDMTYFRIGVPNDMVADIMWNDDFEVSIESYSKHETNYERYFGTPESAAEFLGGHLNCYVCPAECTDGPAIIFPTQCVGCILEWLKNEAE